MFDGEAQADGDQMYLVGTDIQPGDEVLRSQETRRTAGLPRARTIMLDPLPLTQSAELQMRRAEALRKAGVILEDKPGGQTAWRRA